MNNNNCAFDIDGIANHIKETVEEIGKNLPPDADWMPVMEVFDSENNGYVVGLTGFESGEKSSQAMCLAIDQLGGKMVGTVFTAWAVNAKDVMPDDLIRPGMRASSHPDRFEMLIITVMDSNNVKAVAAKIIRDPNQPPVLDEWVPWGQGGCTGTGENHGKLTGQFVEPLQDALRDSSGIPNPEFLKALQKFMA